MHHYSHSRKYIFIQIKWYVDYLLYIVFRFDEHITI